MDIENKLFREKIADTLLDLICLCAINRKSEIEILLLKNPSNFYF